MYFGGCLKALKAFDLGTLLVAQLSHLAPVQFEQLRAIYDDSFPPHERADFSFLVDSIASGARWFFAATRNDDLLGFAIIVPDIARDAHLLDYLAVSRDARGGGIGGILLRHVVDATRASGNIAGILLEVEPDDEGDADERAIRQRRIAFYARHGARV
ncbi:MAG: GNAT family N-acetyltransferase, partial [Anaerolineales bacterium]|nr:GNAT family N-acetyltransferase [Anaerolineales bacterium]